MFKKIVSFVTLLCIFASTSSAMAFNVKLLRLSEYSGKCGSEVEWTLNTETGMLKISGNNKMKNDYAPATVPWYELRHLVKSVVIDEGITSIGRYVFCGCTNLTNVTIPDSVTIIGKHAFEECENLSNITIPNSVETIEDLAFADCKSLLSITIPSSVASIEWDVFCRCKNIVTINVDSGNDRYISCDGILFDKINKSILRYPCGKADDSYVIPEDVVTIEFGAFNFCENITSITIPSSVTTIHNSFNGCLNLKTVYNYSSFNIVEGSTKCGFVALNADRVINKKGKADVDIESLFEEANDNDNSDTNNNSNINGMCGDNLKWELNLETGSFTISGSGDMTECHDSTTVPWNDYREDIKTVTINQGVTSISGTAFYHCSSLTTVTIPDSVTSIEWAAFEDCTNLTSIIIPYSVTSMGRSVFSGCTNLINVAIPDNLTQIDDSLFKNCKSLTGVIIPNKVTMICYSAFDGCTNLKNVKISDSVTSIEAWAFQRCTNLTSVTIPNSVTYISDASFSYCDNLTIYAYSGSYAETYAKENNIKFVSQGVFYDEDSNSETDDKNSASEADNTDIQTRSSHTTGDKNNDSDFNLILIIAISCVAIVVCVAIVITIKRIRKKNKNSYASTFNDYNPVATDANIICPNCNATNNCNSSFCKKCGQKLT
ncbi:MAG: leucine-rich repeat domain-containing protein [Clostridia bacterium]|nr:leucine-rich repeat domain-containing protein [Clostridia bacterium]